MEKKIYTADDLVFKHKRWETKDGEFYTKSDSHSYSYWYKNGEEGALGSHAYDYTFACIEALNDAVKVLNKVLE
jgi:hypothetical protein